MQTVLFLLLALGVLLLMVTIHEFGHYIAGKLLGFKIDEFSIGFGPAIFSHKHKNSDEIFSIRIIPLGGYCAFEGETENSDNRLAFMKQSPIKRIIVLFSGVFFNFLSAVVFSFILLVSTGYDVPEVYTVNDCVKIEVTQAFSGELPVEYEYTGSDVVIQINDQDVDNFTIDYLHSVLALEEYMELTAPSVLVKKADDSQIKLQLALTRNTNASVLQKGDAVFYVDNTMIDFITDDTLVNLIKKSEDNQVDLTVKRNGAMQTVQANIYEVGFVQNGEYAKIIGITNKAYAFSFVESLERCVPYTFGFAWKVLEALGGLVTGKYGLDAVGGPVTTIATIATFSQKGIGTFLVLLPLIAANLAVFNFLPIPALDGSKIVFTIIEWIRKKPINQKVENMIHTIGLLLLFGLVIFADLYQLYLKLFG